jgi:hypothetical protein
MRLKIVTSCSASGPSRMFSAAGGARGLQHVRVVHRHDPRRGSGDDLAGTKNRILSPANTTVAHQHASRTRPQVKASVLVCHGALDPHVPLAKLAA